MPILDRCKKCNTLNNVKDLGANGVCVFCMEKAVVNADTKKQEVPVAKATEEKAGVEITKDGVTKEFETRKQVSEFLGKHVNTIGNAIRKKSLVDGWSIK